MSVHPLKKNVSVPSLMAKKRNGEKIAVITCYDATFAPLIEAAGIEVILVGDSLGMVLQGHDSTLPVTVEHMAYHTRCVARADTHCLLMADMPFGSYLTKESALQNAATLMQAGAHMVKLEGGQWLVETIRALVERGIPVCGHLGLTPQSVNTLGGYRVQGRDEEDAQRIIADAKALEQAGADQIVAECIPSALGKRLSESVNIPIIGIGAGPDTDAQVLVLHDLLGLSPRNPKFVKNFMIGTNSVQAALEAYCISVKNGQFPEKEHGFE